jgi:cysteine desulfurase
MTQKKDKKEIKRVYLDYAATTPVLDEVKEAMNPYFSVMFGNASSLHSEGRVAKEAVATSREKVASIIGCQSKEVTFTSGGTESVNLALLGALRGKPNIKKAHVVISATEHPAVLETCKYLKKEGVRVTKLGVTKDGIVNLEELKSALCDETVIVSIMYVNNETGVIQPITKISKIIKSFREQKKDKNNSFPYFHTDASQAPNYLSVNANKLGVDLLTLDGSKIYGPKGVGILYANSKIVELRPMNFGGGQERGLRSGTENTPSIVGFSEALSVVSRDRAKESDRMKILGAYFASSLLKMPGTEINAETAERVPNIINVCFKGKDAEYLLLQLDEKGVSASLGSACGSDSKAFSHVIKAMRDDNCATSSIRFSLGRGTTKDDIDFATEAISTLIQ